jgi:hypothetical protein
MRKRNQSTFQLGQSHLLAREVKDVFLFISSAWLFARMPNGMNERLKARRGKRLPSSYRQPFTIERS